VPIRDPDITAIARVLADRARATIVLSLLDGAGHSATDLAVSARVSPSTASAHLRTLLAARVVSVERQGRRRIYRLIDPRVQQAVETLASIAPDAGVANPSLTRSVRMRRLAEARQCYDHIGGRLATMLTADFRAKGILKPIDGGYLLHSRANEAFRDWNIDAMLVLDGSPFVRGCADWTEGGSHIGGPLAAALYQRLKVLGAIAIGPGRRYVDRRWPLDRIISLTVEITR
jgi:DNA-binding transcriptional ArsR family regulator